MESNPHLLPKDIGWIEVITGCMFSGKTEELIRRLRRAEIAKQKVSIFKPKIDIRYSSDHLVSHSQTKIKSQMVSSPYEILELSKEIENGNEIISKEQNIIKAQIVWAVKNEMAINIEDFLSRRTRLLLLDQKEAVRIAPIVAEVMAKELGKDEVWQKNEIESFKNIAEIYHTHI